VTHTDEDELLNSLTALAQNACVLYVEDEAEIRDELREMLEGIFSTVITAENGARALKEFQSHKFDLVITDINMPQMTGIELIQEIQKLRPQQAVLVTSAYSDSGNLIPLINLGVGSFVLKPLNWRLFLSLIHKELSASVSLARETLYQQRLELEVNRRTQELQDAERHLLRLQEAKDDMLALISHEIRTPLNGILGFTELVRTLSPTSEAQSFLAQIEESARRLERSTRKALDFTSLSTGNHSLHWASHRVDSLWRAAFEQVRERVPSMSGAQTSWLTPVEVAILYCDGELVVEVFRNLLENIAKYVGADKPLLLSFQQEGLWNRVVVRDNGPGFSEASLATLFHPFSTGNIMHHSEGMGLGLALVDVIMLTLGGRVEAHNHAEGGAEVVLRFPARIQERLASTKDTFPDDRP